MFSLHRLYWVAGGTAAALVAAMPAQAEEISSSVTQAADTADLSLQVDQNLEIAPTGFEMGDALSDLLVETESLAFGSQPTESTVQNLDDYLAETTLATDEAIATSANAFFEGVETADAHETTEDGQEVAQVTRPLYQGRAPFYVGVGGNIGIIDSGNSAVGDFGFNIISKISLGPRFAVRPSLQFSEDDFNITLPITYNFNPLEFANFSVYPAIGGGVDFGDDIGLLINGGVDVPISRDFTLNGQVNWRVTNDTGLGVSLGVGYNFPIFFE